MLQLRFCKMTLDKTPDKSRIEKDVKLLKAWLLKQPHLPKNIDHNLLTAFICGTKSIEIAKKKLDTFCTVRGEYPEIFDFVNRDPLDEKFKQAQSVYRMFYLPSATPEGYRTIIISNEPSLGDYYRADQLIAKLVMTMELGMLLWPDMTGFCVTYDWKNFQKSYLKQINIPVLTGYFKFFQNSYPIKLKRGVHLNVPSFIDIVINMVMKPFMKPKLYERIKFHVEDGNVLKNYYSLESLPSDYGGKEESLAVLDEKWNQLLVEHREWFRSMSLLNSDEDKRLPDQTETYGVQGTFRSLAID